MSIRKYLLGLLFVLLPAASAYADVIFSDDFSARPNNQDIWGTLPATAAPGVGAYGSVLTWPYSGKIDPFTPVGKLLKFDTSVGDDTQMVYVPYAYTFGADRVSLTLRAAHPGNQSGFNNFAIGFASYDAGAGHQVFTDHILVQSNQIQLNFPGADTTLTVPFSSVDFSFYEFVIGYDPTLAGIAGAQPYSLSINGVDVPIPVLPSTVYTPLAGFDAVAFGGRFSGGLTTRFISDFSLEISAVPLPGSLALLALGGLGLMVLGARRGAAAQSA